MRPPNPTRRYPVTRTIGVDVDGTLVVAGHLNAGLVEWCRARRAEGFTVYLWSARGEQHARAMAEHFGVVDAFDMILSKPGVIVDDKLWTWAQYTVAIHPSRIPGGLIDASFESAHGEPA